MTGIRTLQKIQMGRETTAGTAVVATTLWRGLGVPEDGLELVYPDENIGVLAAGDRAYIPKLQGKFKFASVEATFEQLLHIFEAGIKTVGTGVTDTGGSGKVYAYPMTTTVPNTIKTYTLEGGDNAGVERIEYAYVDSFSIDGKAGEALMVEADWIGRQVTTTAGWTPNVVAPSVEEILFTPGRFYLDAIGGTIGTTQVSNTLLEMSVKVKTGWTARWTANGLGKYFGYTRLTGPEVSLDLKFEHNSTAVAEKAYWRAATSRLARLEFPGTALTTAGTYTTKLLRLDFCGKWEKVSGLDDDDGNDILTFTMKPKYNSTAAKFFDVTVVTNGLATVP